jgi:hypothetical protein
VLRGLVLCAIGLGAPRAASAESGQSQVPPGLTPLEQVVTEMYSEPPGAEVKIGDRLLGITPLRLSQKKLKPGTYELTFRLAKHVSVTRRITIVAGTGLRVPRADLVTWPTVRVFAKDASAEGAMLSVDGRSVGAIPITYDLEAGSHVLKVERENHAPWIETIELRNGTHREIPVTLVPQFGKLVIGKGTANELTNVDVVVYEGGHAVSLGTVPTPPLTRRAGQHTLEFRPIGVEPFVRVVQVPVNETEELLVLPPKKLERDYGDPWRYERVKTKQAADDCLTGRRPEACLVAAYAAFHPDGNRTPDLEATEKLYRNGCERKHGYSCFALGYIEKQRAPTDQAAAAHLRQACDVLDRIENACWALYLQPGVVPDPRHNPGDWEFYKVEPDDKPSLFRGDAGGGGLFAMSPGDGKPLYLEGGLQFAMGRQHVQFEIGFALLRLRVLEQTRRSIDESDWDFYIGSGIDIGAKVRPFEKLPVSLRAALRMTAYLDARSSFSFIATVTYPIAREHRIELGLILDKLPLEYERVDVIGERRTIEDYFWRPVIAVRYSYAKEM